MPRHARCESLELRKLLSAADIDVGFGADGFAIVGGSHFIDVAATPAIAVQSDGKVVMVSDYASRTWTRLAVTRLNFDGGLDADWSDDGVCETAMVNRYSNAAPFAKAITIVGEGQVLIAAAEQQIGGGYWMKAQRFNPDGTIDDTLNGAYAQAEVAYKPARMFAGVTGEGQIELVGVAREGQSDLLLYARFDAQGQIDPELGGGVTLSTNASGTVLDLAPMGDGRILLLMSGGGGGDANGPHLAMLKLNGDMDTSFSGDGRTPLTQLSSAADLELLSDGRILVAGASGTGASKQAALLRFGGDGAIDESFADAGQAAGPAGEITRIAIDGDDEIRALGKDLAGTPIILGFSDSGFYDDGQFGAGGFALADQFTTGYVPYQITLSEIAADEDGHVLLPGVVSKPRHLGVDGVGVLRLGRDQEIVHNTLMGHLFIDGTDDDDDLSASLADGTLTVTLNGDDATYASGDVSRLVARLLEGYDAFTVTGNLATFADGGDGTDTLLSGDGIDTLIGGGEGGDTINPGGGVNYITGSGGDDAITVDALESSAVISALAGNDTILCAGGNDWIDAGPGDDNVDGGDNRDTVFGGDGFDTILAGGHPDEVHGGNGNDWIMGGGDDDLLFGDAGRDYLSGGGGRDRIVAGGGNDRLRGGAMGDHLAGQNGDDLLVGGDGVDALWGHAGNDTLDGEAGHDYLLAGNGDDLLLGLDGEADTLAGGDGADTADADPGLDLLELIESTEVT